MAKLRVNLRREGLFEALDVFGDFAEASGVSVRIAAALFVGDEGKALAESGDKVG